MCSLDMIFAELHSLKDLEILLHSSTVWRIGQSDSDIFPNLERLVLHTTYGYFSDRNSTSGRQNFQGMEQFFWDVNDKFPMLRYLGANIDFDKLINEEDRGNLPMLNNLQSFQHTGLLCGSDNCRTKMLLISHSPQPYWL